MASGSGVIEYQGKRGTVWRIKYRDADGRQVMETVGGERDGVTRKQAASELRERLVRVERRHYRKPQPLTFRAATNRWREEMGARNRWRPSTEAQYVSILARLNEAFGETRLAEVRSPEVSAYVTAQLEQRAPATVSRDLSILHAIFEWAGALELVDRNPTRGVQRPTLRQRKGVALTPEQVRLLLPAFTDEQDRVVFLTFVLTGMRRAELQRLRWRDVDVDLDRGDNRLRIVDSKTETGVRSIAVPSTLAEALVRHREASAYKGADERVFCDPQRGTVYRYERFSAALRAAYKAAGLDYPTGLRPCHDLRVTSITNDALAGAHPVAIMTKAGHANMATTKRYLRLAGVVFRDEADALEARLLGEPSTEPSTRLSAPEPTLGDAASHEETVPASADRL
jgi:integrase